MYGSLFPLKLKLNSIVDITPASDSAFTMVKFSRELIIGSKNADTVYIPIKESTLQ
jgi:hypothetical protein